MLSTRTFSQITRLSSSSLSNARLFNTSTKVLIKQYTFDTIQPLASRSEGAKKPLLVDVREGSEFQQGRIPGAVNMPFKSHPDALSLSDEVFEETFEFQKPATTDAVVIYCGIGLRARKAAEEAERLGYKDVGEYQGSFKDWVERGGEIQR